MSHHKTDKVTLEYRRTWVVCPKCENAWPHVFSCTYCDGKGGREALELVGVVDVRIEVGEEPRK